MKPKFPLIGLLLAAVLVLGACGSDAEETDAAAEPAEETESTEAEAEAEEPTEETDEAEAEAEAEEPTEETDETEAEPVVIGAIEMMSGDGAFYGNAVVAGMEVAVEELNASGGILGHPVELKVEDNASDNAQTTTLVTKYAADETVGAIIPPTYQPNFNAACAAATEAGLPIVSAQSGPADPANNTDGLCFTMTTDPVPQVQFTLEQLGERGITSLAMVYDQDNGYVAFQRPNIAAAAEAVGVEIVEIGVPGGTTDFGPQITQLIDAAPDATFPFFTIEDAARFMKQASDTGYEGLWFDPVSQLTSKRLPELSGGSAVGLLSSTPQSAGDIEAFQSFLDAYEALNGEALDDPTYTGFGYDALMNLAAAMEAAGSTTDRAAIKDALASTSAPCYSICFALSETEPTAGAYLAAEFFMVALTEDGFVPAE